MKLKYFFLGAIASCVLFGCAKEKEIMVQSTDQTQKRVHTQEELKKTGETETGAALEKVDPAVQVSHRP
jgi:outer membrane biogenesis lipoprotein LolB